jgi:hypothetical protein
MIFKVQPINALIFVMITFLIIIGAITLTLVEAQINSFLTGQSSFQIDLPVKTLSRGGDTSSAETQQAPEAAEPSGRQKCVASNVTSGNCSTHNAALEKKFYRFLSVSFVKVGSFMSPDKVILWKN